MLLLLGLRFKDGRELCFAKDLSCPRRALLVIIPESGTGHSLVWGEGSASAEVPLSGVRRDNKWSISSRRIASLFGLEHDGSFFSSSGISLHVRNRAASFIRGLSDHVVDAALASRLVTVTIALRLGSGICSPRRVLPLRGVAAQAGGLNRSDTDISILLIRGMKKGTVARLTFTALASWDSSTPPVLIFTNSLSGDLRLGRTGCWRSGTPRMRLVTFAVFC